MIYEMRTYPLKPGTVPEFEERFGQALPHREKYSKLGAFWHTEIGPLDQVIHVWPYADAADQARVRAAAAQDPNWPPKTQEFTLSMESEILHPAPFMRPLEPRAMGSIYEMRIYTYQSGSMPEVLKRWGEAIEERERHSPLAACWYTDVGVLNRFFHVWPYRDFAERERVRQESRRNGHWPPPTREFLLRQENKLLAPAAFSPLK
ncbi:MAG: NIPSNAP family protein [Dehalococcoidia bacterium]|nr:NIPSNAP family protein [Dehalococcoidia bacterium]